LKTLKEFKKIIDMTENKLVVKTRSKETRKKRI
jgi:hypothetical protein